MSLEKEQANKSRVKSGEREREREREKSIVIINITIENLGKYGIFLKIWEDKMMKQRMKKIKKVLRGAIGA